MKMYGASNEMITDRFISYRAALRKIDVMEKQKMGRWLNKRVENSQLPLQRRERAMLRFWRIRSSQKSVSVHSFIHNYFNQERSLASRDTFKLTRTTALAELRELGAA